MTVEMLKGKIHRATVVQAELDYVGSITVDEELLEAAGIMEYEKVQIVDVNNGSRFENYEAEEAKEHKPKVVFVDDENKISRVTNYEKHGLLKDQEK